MKVDSEGNVYCTGPGGIHVIGPDGGLLGRIRIRPLHHMAWATRLALAPISPHIRQSFATRVNVPESRLGSADGLDLRENRGRLRRGTAAWPGRGGMLFSAVGDGKILRYDPKTGGTGILRRYTNRTNGLAFAPDGALYGCQESSRARGPFRRRRLDAGNRIPARGALSQPGRTIS